MSPGQVLVVADDARLASFLLAGLRDEGYDVHLATSSPAAAALDQILNFDMVLVDHRLVHGSVGALVRGWRMAGRSMPVILLTERTNPGEHLDSLAAGTTAFLPKPFPIEAMFNMVREMLRA